MQHQLERYTDPASGRSLSYYSAQVDWSLHSSDTHTAYTIWRPSSCALAACLLRHPALCLHARVIEFGAGCSALPSCAALASGALSALATDAEAPVLPIALASLRANAAPAPALEQSGVALLRWDSAAHAAAIAAAGAPPFCLGLASDVLWLRSLDRTDTLAEQAGALLACARRLLRGWGAGCACQGAPSQPCGVLALSFQRRGGDLVGALGQAAAAAAVHCAYVERDWGGEGGPASGSGGDCSASERAQEGAVHVAVLCPCLPCLTAALQGSGLARAAVDPCASSREREEELYARSARWRRGVEEGEEEGAARGGAGGEGAGGGGGEAWGRSGRHAPSQQLHTNPLFRKSALSSSSAWPAARGSGEER